MPLQIGSHLGSYEITGRLGAGAMGEVYRAKDKHLGRDVAIKVLPDAFAHDVERLARFGREARTLAALNHPNIGQIYGIEADPAAAPESTHRVRALVMELVDGPTLADRIARGRLSVDEALAIARQIADALEAAHEHRIIHRDLKPANIKVRADGTVKVLDFGLAKAMPPASDVAANESSASTITNPPVTELRAVLGTPAYMSPEQCKGLPADTRSDIWAFGCVLYEMLTGRRAFGGANVSETMAAVLRGEPDWSALPRNTPLSVRRLLARCLEKDRTRRLQHAADAAIRIGEASSEPDRAMAVGPSRWSNRFWPLALAVPVIVSLALAMPLLRHFGKTTPRDSQEIRTTINVPATVDPLSFALSPDGTQVVFAAFDQNVQRLWLRKLASADALPLPGTDGASLPFWKPDSRSIGFFADGKLKVLDVDAGQPRTLSAVSGARGGTWNANDVILFEPSATSALVRMALAGGSADPATKLGTAIAHRHPQFLPDGRHFLCFVAGVSDVQGIYLGALDSSDLTKLTASNTAGVYFAPGWLLWVRDGTLIAQRLEVEKRTLIGDPVPVASPVMSDTFGGTAASASLTGLVAYRSGLQGRRQLRWRDRSGKQLGVVGDPDESGMNHPSLSPDSRFVAVHRTVDGNMDIWLLDSNGRMSRLTTNAGLDRSPIWSPKSNRLAFDTLREGGRHTYIRAAIPGGREEVLSDQKAADGVALDWSPDERFLVYTINFDLWVSALDTPQSSFPVLASEFTEKGAQFSPDGRLLAYMSNESGRMEVYVGRFLEPGKDNGTSAGIQGQVPVSTAGGIAPRWAPDGRELYYLAPDGTMMAVTVRVAADSVERSAPVALFATQIVGGGVDNQQGWQYDVARDGRFLINTQLGDATPITLLQNWRAR